MIRDEPGLAARVRGEIAGCSERVMGEPASGDAAGDLMELFDVDGLHGGFLSSPPNCIARASSRHSNNHEDRQLLALRCDHWSRRSRAENSYLTRDALAESYQAIGAVAPTTSTLPTTLDAAGQSVLGRARSGFALAYDFGFGIGGGAPVTARMSPLEISIV